MAAKHMVGGGVMVSGKAKAKSAKHVKRLSVERSANGGHVVSHEFHQGGQGQYLEPEQHTFGADEHGKLMGHLKKHLGLKSGKKNAPMTPMPGGDKAGAKAADDGNT